MTNQSSRYDAIVVGGGIAGLTAAAYLTRAGHPTLLCEQASELGGLVGTIERQGFSFDIGIRAFENSGIIFPMLEQLGIALDVVKSPVALGIEDQLIRVTSVASLEDYRQLLTRLYPESQSEIGAIVRQLERIMGYMDVLYGIDNPAFRDLTQDPVYLLKVILPWILKYTLTVPKIKALKVPVVDYLRRFTQNRALLDIIAQHFFADTPAFFALSYFTLYLDYVYPRGGTGQLPAALSQYVSEHGGLLRTDTEIVSVEPSRRILHAADGQRYAYGQLIWAADSKALYDRINTTEGSDLTIAQTVTQQRAELADKIGGDSVLTLFLSADLPPAYFAERAGAHFFYTPSRQGQSQAGPWPLGETRDEIASWLERFLSLTTYEISFPVLRDPSLAPPGQTGLIVSILFDHALVTEIEAAGWYEAFKDLIKERIIAVLQEHVFPGLGAAVIDSLVSTPLTLARRTGNSDGAITGWAFTNDPMPAETRMFQIAQSVRTPLPNILQAGQWSYSPSGLPISILTGRIAADEALKGP